MVRYINYEKRKHEIYEIEIIENKDFYQKSERPLSKEEIKRLRELSVLENLIIRNGN